MTVGFAGLGRMGEAIAANLCRAGEDLLVYNRTPGKTASLAALGARVAGSPSELFEACDTILLMLADEEAVDAVLERKPAGIARSLQGRTIVNMGTHCRAFSMRLERDIASAGGSYVEAPVSGSRIPAERGELVAILAGESSAVARARRILAPACRAMVSAGPVPNATALKLAVNLYLITMVAGLAEATALARNLRVDLALFRTIIADGPLGSPAALAKLDKMVAGDFSAQASIDDVCKNARLVAEAARGCTTPLLAASRQLFERARSSGHGASDMAAVLRVVGDVA